MLAVHAGPACSSNAEHARCPLPLATLLQRCQSVTAARISASRLLYQAGVKACTLSPWRWARNTNSSELDERHDASHVTSWTSAHRNLNWGPDVYGEVLTAAGITKSAPFPDRPQTVSTQRASARRFRPSSYPGGLSSGPAARGPKGMESTRCCPGFSASTGEGSRTPRLCGIDARGLP
jgi:hypothetical protein